MAVEVIHGNCLAEMKHLIDRGIHVHACGLIEFQHGDLAGPAVAEPEGHRTGRRREPAAAAVAGLT